MSKKDKKKFYDMIEKKTGVISKPTEVKEYHTLIASGFPIQLFREWKEKCEKKYSDTYWTKIWTDHLKAEAYDNLLNSVEEQEEPVQEENKEEKIPLIGDGER